MPNDNINLTKAAVPNQQSCDIKPGVTRPEDRSWYRNCVKQASFSTRQEMSVKFKEMM